MASNKRFLKAYARFDGSGRIVPSSVILRKNKPKVGNWKEVQAYQCCNYEPVPFISVWRTTAPNESITLPYQSFGKYSGVVDWGDGTTSPNSYANRTHIYATAGDYTITILGTTFGFSLNGSSSASKIRSVSQWGTLQLGETGSYFANCVNLDLSEVTDVLDLTGITYLNSMFNGCTSLTTVNRIDEWNVSNITDMSYMFNFATLFNQDISAWDVSNVTNMNLMFSNTAFNQNISSWNVSSVTNMSGMFQGASLFNQPLNSWNVGNVTDMSGMFTNANAFNQDLNSWNVFNVITMERMFLSADVFNGNITSWDTNNVETMNAMFGGASLFNQNISGWDVVAVSNMQDMFNVATSFNQNLSTWCVTLIPSLPLGFATGASAWVLPKPVWGTCP